MKGMKTGGRQKGTPNKDNPLKGFLRTHSLAYFEPREGTDGTLKSDFDRDIAALDPEARVNAELRLLEYHTPRMKAIDMDMTAHLNVRTIEDKLRALCDADTDDDEDEED